MKKLIGLALLALIQSGCVSLGYHHNKVIEAHQMELDHAQYLARQVYDDKLTVHDMISLLREDQDRWEGKPRILK